MKESELLARGDKTKAVRGRERETGEMPRQIDRPRDRQTSSSTTNTIDVCSFVCIAMCVCCQLAYVVWFTDIFCHLLYPTLSSSTCSSHCSCLLIAGRRDRENGKKGGKTAIKQRHVAQVHRTRSCNKHVASCI